LPIHSHQIKILYFLLGANVSNFIADGILTTDRINAYLDDSNGFLPCYNDLPIYNIYNYWTWFTGDVGGGGISLGGVYIPGFSSGFYKSSFMNGRGTVLHCPSSEAGMLNDAGTPLAENRNSYRIDQYPAKRLSVNNALYNKPANVNGVNIFGTAMSDRPSGEMMIIDRPGPSFELKWAFGDAYNSSSMYYTHGEMRVCGFYDGHVSSIENDEIYSYSKADAFWNEQ
jgi:hypothetical protein